MADSEVRQKFEALMKSMARRLVQKPPDPDNPGVIEAKRYVMFDDAVAALTEAYEAGEIAMREKAANRATEFYLAKGDALDIARAIRELAISGAEESKK